MNLRSFAFWAMIVFVFILGVYLVIYIRSESYACMNDPASYAIIKSEEANQAPVVCTCSVQKANGATVRLDKDGFSQIEREPNQIDQTQIINISLP